MPSTYPDVPVEDDTVRILDDNYTWDDLRAPLRKDYKRNVVRAEIWHLGKCVIALACDPNESTVKRAKDNNQDKLEEVVSLELSLLNPLGKNVEFVATINEDKFFDNLDIGEHDIVRSNGLTLDGLRVQIDGLTTLLKKPLALRASKSSALGNVRGFKNLSKKMFFGICASSETSSDKYPVFYTQRSLIIGEDADSWRLPDLETEFDSSLSTVCLARPSTSWISASQKIPEFSLEFSLSTNRVAKAWNSYPARRYLDALKIVKADSDLSFVPLIDRNNITKAEEDQAIGAAVDGPPKEKAEWIALYAFDWKSLKAIDVQPIKSSTAKLSFESVILHSGDDCLEFSAELFGDFTDGWSIEESRRKEEVWKDKVTTPYYGHPRISFGLVPVKLESTAVNISRVGALDLCFAEKFVSAPENSNFFRITLNKQLPEVDAYLGLPLTDFLPAGQDDVPGASRFNEQFESLKFKVEKPIVIVIDNSGDGSAEEFHPLQAKDRFLLEVEEKSSERINRTLTLRIKDVRAVADGESEANAEPRTVVVVDRQPFFSQISLGFANLHDYLLSESCRLIPLFIANCKKTSGWNFGEPRGCTFDTDTNSPLFVNTAVYFDAPNLYEGEDESTKITNASWHFLRVQFRRVVNAESFSPAERLESDATSPTWVQLLQQASLFQEKSTKPDAPVIYHRASDLTLLLRSTGADKFEGQFSSKNVLKVLEPTKSDDNLFSLWLMVTRNITDAFGRKNNEKFITIIPYTVGKCEGSEMSKLFNPKYSYRGRLVEIQSLPGVPAKSAVEFFNLIFIADKNADATARIVRVSEPFDIAT